MENIQNTQELLENHFGCNFKVRLELMQNKRKHYKISWQDGPTCDEVKDSLKETKAQVSCYQRKSNKVILCELEKFAAGHDFLKRIIENFRIDDQKGVEIYDSDAYRCVNRAVHDNFKNFGTKKGVSCIAALVHYSYNYSN